MWPQGGNRVKRNGEKVTETVTDLFFFRNARFCLPNQNLKSPTAFENGYASIRYQSVIALSKALKDQAEEFAF